MAENRKTDITVVGSGSWATALAMLLTTNKRKITWYIDRPEIFRHIRRYHNNPHYISSVYFDPEFTYPVDEINEAIEASPVVILVTPAVFLKSGLEGLRPELLKDKTVCSGIKGIVPGDNTVVGEFIHNQYGVSYDHVVIVTGPSHAEEVSMEKLTYLTFASPDTERASAVARLFANRWLLTSISGDIFGTEYAAVMKNIYSIAAGICHGLGYGDNFLAVLLANSAGEMSRFVEAISPDKRDITNSAYLGDLLVTGYSQFSRNRTFGYMIGKGYTVHNALLEMTMIAEGYYAANCIHEVTTRKNIEVPIAEAVYRILYQESPAAKEIKNLTKLLK